MLNPDNATLEWCAKWIEDSLRAETSERTIEFGKNMAMTIRAVKTARISPASTAPVVNAMWEALKAECCKNPAEAKTVVFCGEDKFKKAMALYAAAATTAPVEQSDSLLAKITQIADIGSAEEFGDAIERLRAIRKLIATADEGAR